MSYLFSSLIMLPFGLHEYILISSRERNQVGVIILLVRFEEVLDDLHELFAFFPHRNVARFLKGQPFDLGDLVEVRLDHKVLRHIGPPVQQKRRNVDLVQTINNGPTDERPRVPVYKRDRVSHTRPTAWPASEERDWRNRTHMAMLTVGSPPSPVSLSPNIGSNTALAISFGGGLRVHPCLE